jgi:hypothetical protein
VTLSEFKLLSKIQQYETLRDKGVFVIDRSEGEFKFLLYQLDGFYLEVKYHKSSNRILRLKAFANIDLLKAYLKKIQRGDDLESLRIQ